MTKNSFVAEVTFNYTPKAISVLEIFVLHVFLPLSVFLFKEVDRNKTLTFVMSLNVYRPKYMINLIKFTQNIIQNNFLCKGVF